MMRITLDTNAYSAFMRGDQSVLEALAGADIVYVPLFVVGELHFGFRGGNRLKENLAELRSFLAKPTVQLWLATEETPQIYGEIQDRLKRAGTPIPINDIWIASACIETGSRLVTFDQHFDLIPGLRRWQDG
jgi:tRNA(fMet)-specific endonuclease VapC